MTKLTIVFALTIALLSGCTSAVEERLITQDITPVENVASRYSSIEVREVSLPTYASGEEIFLASASGKVTSSGDLLWADDPTRAVTLSLSRNLSEVTNVRVAPEPWPFDSYPSARVDVRIADMLATADGQFRLSGQYFVAPQDGQGRERARLFNLTTPIGEHAGGSNIVQARAKLIADLAVLIAKDGLR